MSEQAPCPLCGEDESFMDELRKGDDARIIGAAQLIADLIKENNRLKHLLGECTKHDGEEG